MWWQNGDGPRNAGKLSLAASQLFLSGTGSCRLAVPLEEIVSVEYSRGELEIERRAGPPLRIGNLDGVGALLELSHALAA